MEYDFRKSPPRVLEEMWRTTNLTCEVLHIEISKRQDVLETMKAGLTKEQKATLVQKDPDLQRLRGLCRVVHDQRIAINVALLHHSKKT